MKKNIQTFLCKILEWTGASVAINLEITGKVKGRTNQVFYYSNDLRNATVLDFNEEEVSIPEGKFNITIEKK